MALTDPQSITVAAIPSSLARVETGPTSAKYAAADGTQKFSVSQQFGKRTRTLIRLDSTKITPNALTDVKESVSSSVYIMIDRPLAGFTTTELKDYVLALTKWVNDGTAANLLKVLGGES